MTGRPILTLEGPMTIILTLTPDQIGQSTIDLTAAQLASIHAQENAPAPGPAPGGPLPPLPAPVTGWPVITTEVPWRPGARVFSGSGFGSGKVWRVHVTTPSSIPSGLHFAGAEWIDQGTFRFYAIQRDDGTVLLMKDGARDQAKTITIYLTAGSSNPPANVVHVDPSTGYSLLIWDAQPGQSHTGMFMDLIYQ